MSEFLSSEGLRRGIRSVHDGAYFTKEERPLGIQIYGSDPETMAEAARLVSEYYAPDFVDINLGCPVKKVVKRNGGSGCLKDLGLVQRIIVAVRGATHLPVTVKIRSGWSEATRDPVEIALRCQDAGVGVLTLHPRTRTQMYKGEAQWHEIAAVKDALEIPVIGNGDIKTVGDALRMRKETNCDGLMIARGSFGNPWLFQRIRDAFEGREPRPEPTPAERIAVAMHHATLQFEIQGDSRRTAVEFRKHLGWYIRGMPGAADLRRRLHEIESMGQIREIFDEYRGPMVAAG